MKPYVQKVLPLIEEIRQEKEALVQKMLMDQLSQGEVEVLVQEEMKSGLKSYDQAVNDVKSKLVDQDSDEEELLFALAVIFDYSSEILVPQEADSLKEGLEAVAKNKKLNLPDELIILVEKMGIHFYEKGSYKEALSLFSLLTQFKPKIWKFWLSKGHAARMLHRLEEAKQAYLFASMHVTDSPLPLLYAADLMPKEKRHELLDIAEELIEHLNVHNEYKKAVSELRGGGI
jgi:tetratricopeptide (TPR) repeat protein